MSNCCVAESTAALMRAPVKCRKCGEAGQPVATLTLKQMARPHLLEAVGKPGLRISAVRRIVTWFISILMANNN